MTHKPHTITEEILKEFDNFLGGKLDPYPCQECGLGQDEYGGGTAVVKQFIAQALHRQREEIVKSLRMEKERHGDFNTTDYCDDECCDCAWNQAIDEFNAKLDELLK